MSEDITLNVAEFQRQVHYFTTAVDKFADAVELLANQDFDVSVDQSAIEGLMRQILKEVKKI